jgi:hypothetical protein
MVSFYIILFSLSCFSPAFDQINASILAGVPLILRPPKRPVTPFVLFYNRTFPSPGSRPGGVMSSSKEAGTAWRRLTEAEKQVRVLSC